MHEPQKMCMMCMVLSPNCCAVTIFEYSTTEVTLPSCLSVASEHVASQSKWLSADLDLLLKSFQTRVFKHGCVFNSFFIGGSKPIHLTRIRCSGWVRAA